MDISRVWSRFYGHFPDDEIKAVELVADMICWCRANDVHVYALCKDASKHVGFEFWKEKDIGLLAMMIGHPNMSRMKAMEEDEVEEPRPANQTLDQHTQNFELVLSTFYNLGSKDKPRDAAVNAIGDLFRKIDDIDQIGRVLVAASSRFDKLCGGGGISPDEFYSRAELVDFFKDLDVVDRCMTELGLDPNDEEKLISGKEIIAWIKELPEDEDTDGGEVA